MSNNLIALMEKIDEVKGVIAKGDYLDICNMMKGLHEDLSIMEREKRDIEMKNTELERRLKEVREDREKEEEDEELNDLLEQSNVFKKRKRCECMFVCYCGHGGGW